MSLRRHSIVFVHDVLIASLSLPLALYLRVGGDFVATYSDLLLYGSPAFAVLAGATFHASGMYRGVWRYASMSDLTAVVKSATVAVLVFMPLMFLANWLTDVPRSVPVIQWLILIVLLGGPRSVYRMLQGTAPPLSPPDDHVHETAPEAIRKSSALLTLAVNDHISRGAATSAGILAIMVFYLWFFPSKDPLVVAGMVTVALLIILDNLMVWFRYRFGVYGDTALELVEIIEFLERHRDADDIGGTKISRFEPETAAAREQSRVSGEIRTISRM